MVGLCGIIGDNRSPIDTLRDRLVWTDRERTEVFDDGKVAVAAAFHPGPGGGTVAVDDDEAVRAWVWGGVYEYAGEKHHVRGRQGSAAFCIDRYVEHGPSFAAGLNGEFLCLLYDRERQRFIVITDRLGSYPCYYDETDSGVVFSTDVQSLPCHTGVEPEFDPAYLAEYLGCGRTFGTKTPLTGIEQFPPASIVTFDPGSDQRETTEYWRPRYRPVDRSLSALVDSFGDRFRRAVALRTQEDAAYGLMLSGGSDSRLVLASSEPTKAYHLAGWKTREAAVARKVARTAGCEFDLLRMDHDHDRMLERNASILNFTGTFETGRATEFASRITSDVDVLLSGLYADVLFSGWDIPQRELVFPSGFRRKLPITNWPSDTTEYIDSRSYQLPPFVKSVRSLQEIVRANISARRGRIFHHGVEYDSVQDLVVSNFYYPLTNETAFDRYGYQQILPHRTPFLDRHLLDLHLTIPVRDVLRRDVVSAALSRLDSDLAGVRHAASGVPPQFSPVVHAIGKLVLRGYDALTIDPPEPYLDHGPWPDISELIRKREFIGERLDQYEQLIDALPLVDYEATVVTYRAHRRGADYGRDLYRLLSLLAMPVTAEVLGEANVR